MGICGRTGAGKSSLLVALFRLFEPEPGSSIRIDGIEILNLNLNLNLAPETGIKGAGTGTGTDTRGGGGGDGDGDGGGGGRLSLQSLRSRIGIIPQDPVMFSGSLRDNLDPFDDFTDEQVWSALRMVQLDSLVRGFVEGLQVNFCICTLYFVLCTLYFVLTTACVFCSLFITLPC